MKSKFPILYAILVLLMALDIYSIFNAGNPESLFRYVIRDPKWDIVTTGVLSLGIVIIVIIMNSKRTKAEDPVYLILLENRAYIEKLREKGKGDAEIAASFIGSLKAGKLTKKIAYHKALTYLKRI